MVSRVSVTGNGTDDGSAPEAYYRPGPDGVFTPTKATESPWSTDAQHGGPPSALFGHVIRSRHPEPGFRIARLTVEFLGTVPRSDVEGSTQMVRDGRRIRLIEASMSVAGKRVALARAWQIAVNKDVLAAADRKPPQPADLPPVPDEQQQFYFGGRENWGYGEATEWRRVHGSFRSTGYAQVWTRLRIPLIVGQRKIDPLDRILVVADSANGVSSALDPRDWLFVP